MKTQISTQCLLVATALLLAANLAFLCLNTASPAHAAPATTFEYQSVYVLYGYEPSHQLNGQGTAGWRVVAVTDAPTIPGNNNAPGKCYIMERQR